MMIDGFFKSWEILVLNTYRERKVIKSDIISKRVKTIQQCSRTRDMEKVRGFISTDKEL